MGRSWHFSWHSNRVLLIKALVHKAFKTWIKYRIKIGTFIICADIEIDTVLEEFMAKQGKDEMNWKNESLIKLFVKYFYLKQFLFINSPQ